MAKATDVELRRYGFVRGTLRKWCAACGFTCDNMGEGGFKCRSCAVKQWSLVERECRVNQEGE